MSKEVAHQIEKLSRELILEIDKSDLQSDNVITKVREMKGFLSSLDAARKRAGVPNPFQIIIEEVGDEQL